MWTKKRVTDLLFGVQMVGGTIFGVSQFIRMLKTAQGVNVSWFVSWEVFLFLNLGLAINAHRAQPSRVTRQTLASYITWVILVTANAIVMLWKDGGTTWDHKDTVTAELVGLAAIVSIGYGYTKGLGIVGSVKDPLIKGLLALAFKSIPQLALAYKMYQIGGAGLAALTVINGHITVLTRLGQLVFAIKEAGWDRNRLGSAVSEIGNELSWAIATVVWIFR